MKSSGKNLSQGVDLVVVRRWLTMKMQTGRVYPTLLKIFSHGDPTGNKAAQRIDNF